MDMHLGLLSNTVTSFLAQYIFTPRRQEGSSERRGDIAIPHTILNTIQLYVDMRMKQIEN